MRIKVEYGPDGDIICVHQEEVPEIGIRAEVLGIERPMFGPPPEGIRPPPEKRPQNYLCLIQDDNGPMYTRECYDYMPPHIRRRLAESPFNLCAACVMQAMNNGHHAIDVIMEMERMIREGR